MYLYYVSFCEQCEQYRVPSIDPLQSYVSLSLSLQPSSRDLRASYRWLSLPTTAVDILDANTHSVTRSVANVDNSVKLKIVGKLSVLDGCLSFLFISKKFIN